MTVARAVEVLRGRAGMDRDEKHYLETRSTLLIRLKSKEDEEGWLEFFALYWRLIYNVARRAGLGHEDAQDIVQETILQVYKGIDRFQYERKKGAFKSWLRVVTRSRISNFFARQRRQPFLLEDAPGGDEAMEQLEDPRGPELERIWDEEWRDNLVDAALELLKKRVSPEQYQIFHSYVVKGWSAAEVARTMGVSRAQVYLAKHRVGLVFQEALEEARESPL